MRKPPPILGIALTVFIDMLGFGLIIPDIQLRGEKLGAHGFLLGLTIATFSIAQLLTAPLMGRWSDSIGRRKVLLVTTTLAACSYFVYSHAFLLPVLIAARVLNGIGGANLPVAFAYIADVTKPEGRTKAMGLIGASFGLGFIFGPGIGAWLVKVGNGSPTVLGYTASALCVLNFLYVYFFLQESLQPSLAGSHLAEERAPSLENLAKALATPGLGFVLLLSFATQFGFSNMESTYFRMTEHVFGMKEMQTAMVLVEVGIVMAIMQGGVVRILVPKFGEVNLLRVAYFLQIPGLFVLPWAHPWIPLVLATLVLGTGAGLAQPSISGLISLFSPPEMQGGVFGVSQSLGAFARILGPIVGNTLFDIDHRLPYIVAAGIVFLPFLGSLKLKAPQSVRHEAATALAG